VRSTQHEALCAAHDVLNWISAFAGMTVRFEMKSMRTVATRKTF